MRVYYRISDTPSPHPLPFGLEQGFDVTIQCLKSFVTAFYDTNPYVVFILDNCTKDYKEKIKQLVPFEHDIKTTTLGNFEACLYQYTHALATDDEVLLFAEDDYLWKANIGHELEQAIAHYGLVSPYDHKNFYLDSSIHSPNPILEIYNNHHYRSTERNVMTFGMSRQVFKNNYRALKKWGTKDDVLWEDIDTTMMVPVPCFATHMIDEFLAPGADWRFLWNALEQ